MTPVNSPSGKALAALALLAAATGPVHAQTTDQLRRQTAEVGVEERLGAVLPRDATFNDSEGRPLTLASLGGRPLLLSFNYTSCPRLCGLQLAGLARALKESGWAGDRFAIATVSIDPKEQVAQLARYKQSMIREVGGAPAAEAAWHFLTGRQADVDALAAAVGFRYRYDAASGEFAHQATLVVVTGDGRVSGYLHGIRFPQAALREALGRAEGNLVATAAEQRTVGGFLLTCMGFDPRDPTPLALKLMRAGGGVALLFLLSFLGFHALRGAQRRRLQGRTP